MTGPAGRDERTSVLTGLSGWADHLPRRVSEKNRCRLTWSLSSSRPQNSQLESLVKQDGPVGRSCAWNEVGEGREFARVIAVKERRVALMAFRKAVGNPLFPEQEGVRHVVF